MGPLEFAHEGAPFSVEEIEMARITVKHRHGQSFDIRVRGYALISDEPVTLGGDDEGPTPTELMVAGLAACAADETVSCLASSGEKFEPTEVGADFAWDLDSGRVASIRLSISLADEISDSTRDNVLRAMRSCAARKMLVEPPTIEYEFNVGGVRTLVGSALNGASWPAEPPPDVDSQE
jgi:putative redox protein